MKTLFSCDSATLDISTEEITDHMTILGTFLSFTQLREKAFLTIQLHPINIFDKTIGEQIIMYRYLAECISVLETLAVMVGVDIDIPDVLLLPDI